MHCVMPDNLTSRTFKLMKCTLGLPLGLEAPIMTPNGVIFLISLSEVHFTAMS